MILHSTIGHSIKQECIRVGCVPSACCPYLPACTAPGVYLVRGGVPGLGGVRGPGGCTWSGGVYLVWGGTWSGGVPGPGEGVKT